MIHLSYITNIPVANVLVERFSDMEWMFFGAEAFNQDISKWDVSNVTDMGIMFNKAISFNQDISNWDIVKHKAHVSYFTNIPIFNTFIVF
jgi:surface protein